MDVATTAITTLNQAVNVLSKAATNLGERVSGIKEFLTKYQEDLDKNNKDLLEKYDKLITNQTKSLPKPIKASDFTPIFNDFSKKLLDSGKNLKDDKDKGISQDAMSQLSANFEKLSSILIAQFSTANLNSISNTDLLSRILEQGKTVGKDSFETESEIENKRKITVDKFSEESISALKSIFTPTQKATIDSPKNKSSGGGMLEKLGNIALLGIVAVGITAIAIAVAHFADIPTENIVKMAAVMGLMGAAIYGLTKIPKEDILALSIGLGIMTLAIYGVVYSLQQMSDINWETILKGIAVFGGLTLALLAMAEVAPMTIIGAAALGVAALALYGMTAALNNLSGVDWASVGLFGVFLISISGGLALLGSLFPILAPGIVILAGLSATFLLFGAGLTAVGAGMQLLVPTLPILSQFLKDITSVNPISLYALAPGIVAFSASLGVLSAAMLVFSASNLISGTLGAISGFFASIVPEKELAKIQTAVDALKSLKNAQNDINLKPISDALAAFAVSIDKIDTNKTSSFANTLLKLAPSANLAAPALTKLSSVNLTPLANNFVSLTDASVSLLPPLNAIAAIDLRSLINQSRGLQSVMDAINSVDSDTLNALSKADFSIIAKGLKEISSISNLDLSQPIAQVRNLVDVINDVSLLKVGAISSILSAGKTLDVNIKASEPTIPKAPNTNTGDKETLVAKEIAESRKANTDQLDSIINLMQITVDVLQKQKTATQIIAPTTNTIVGGGGNSNNKPVISPTPLSTKALSGSASSINGRTVK